MSARFLLDTNIVSYLLKRQSQVAQSRFEAEGPDTVVVSAITKAEIFFGLARIRGATRLTSAAENFLSAVAVAPWDSAAARAYGILRAAQERKGRPLSVEDLMIAAHAISLGLILVTSDSAFAHIDGLRTEDWTRT